MIKFSIETKKKITLSEIDVVLTNDHKLELSTDCRNAIITCRKYLDAKVNSTDTPIYGVNTGFGALCNVRIESSQLSELQANLVRSHACGTGNEIPQRIVKLMLFLKIRSLSYGNSGVSIETMERLVFFFNEDILPI